MDNGTPYFILKDHLGSTRVVLNSSSKPVTWYDYSPYGALWRSTISEDLHYRFTGQEYDAETNLNNFRARMYDGTLGIFYAGDPAGQGFSPYMYCGGNPTMYVDKDGRFFFLIPVIVGALIGGTIGGATYAVMSGHSFTWSGFGESFGLGAIGGALSGGFGALGTSLGSLGQNMAYNLLSNGASFAATTAISGHALTLNGFLGATFGGLIGGLLPGYQAMDGSPMENVAAEIGYNSFKGALSAGFGGSASSLLNGENPGDGFLQGAEYGAASGAVQSGFQIAAFGYAIKPTDQKTIQALNDASQEFSSVGQGFGLYGPVYRSGGLWSLFTTRGISIGRNLVIPDNDPYTFIHETMHYFQYNMEGYGSFLSRGMYEQWFMADPYSTPGTQEWAADRLYDFYYNNR